MTAEGVEPGLALQWSEAGAVRKIVPKIGPVNCVLALGVCPAGLGNHPLAVVTERFAVGESIIPDKSGGSPSQGIDAFGGFATGVSARRIGCDLTFDVFVGHGAIGPLMAIGAADARAKGIVEQHKF